MNWLLFIICKLIMTYGGLIVCQVDKGWVIMAILGCQLDYNWNELQSSNGGHTCYLDIEARTQHTFDSDLEAG